MSKKKKDEVTNNTESQERVVTPIDNQPVEYKIDDKAIATEQLQNPAGVPSFGNDEDALVMMKGPRAAELGMSVEDGAVKYPEYQRNASQAISAIEPKLPAGATQQNPTGVPKAKVFKSVPKTLSDYLAEQRANLQKDKTDAVKMQKYYALTDALRTLGEMGGTAVGGAIGGDTAGGALNIGEYQQSRGYIDAFEKAKQANDRLRALDEQEFSLAYNKQQRDEERAYQAAEKKADRDYRQQENELERQWQMKFYDYKTQIEQAIAEKDWTRSAELKLQMAKDEQAHAMELQRLRNKGALDEKRLGLETSKWQADTYNMVPIAFDDGSGVEIAEKDYEGLKRRYIGRKIGDRTITKDNIDLILGQNPQLVRDYFDSIGRKVSFTNAKVAEEAKAETGQSTGVSTPSGKKVGQRYYYYNPMSDQTMIAPAQDFEGDEQTQKPAQKPSQKPATKPANTTEAEEDINDYIEQFL